MNSLAARRYAATVRWLRSESATSSTYRGPPLMLERFRQPAAWPTPPMVAPSVGRCSPPPRTAVCT
eukprot:10123579-Lingulodinium_polyedra.AAC.1